MWWWRRRICGGGSAGYVGDKLRIILNSAQLELELGLGLDNKKKTLIVGTLFSILNISNNKFSPWLVEIKLGCFSSCISLVEVKSNFVLSRWWRRICGGCGAGYVVVVAQDMWWWWCRICGGGGAGYVVVVAQDMWWIN